MKLGFMRLALGTALVGATLSAQAVQVKWEGFTSAGSVAVNVGTPTYNGSGGAFNIKIDGNPFVTYCVELGQSAATGPFAYNSVPAQWHFDPNRANRLGKLFTYLNTDPTHSPSSGIGAGGIGVPGTTTYSGAIQLAIWESVFETGSSLSLSSGSFQGLTGTNASALTLANTLLTGATAILDASIGYSVNILTNGTYQDYITIRKGPPNQNEIPEPASWALAGLALAGLGVARRRRA